ncbi:hypothetical protein [Streptomyces dysideae]|uniref:Uncharacterized protein n=1 Tax=Streptomyces dysideae TaxID=909626 RepID=A0A101USR0_9ACTN|nr:hypothetical protein [Streptomyces dysideae]KUO16180.1 hypothetical protein AQJ91_36715 [Streptomyces dysideae]
MLKLDQDSVVHRGERALWKLYLEDPQYGSLSYDGHHGWSLLQGRYTVAVFFEHAATLGPTDSEYVTAGAREEAVPASPGFTAPRRWGRRRWSGPSASATPTIDACSRGA